MPWGIEKMLCGLLLAVFLFPAVSFAKEWNGIVPCVSRRSDVEKRLGRDVYRVPNVLGSYRTKGYRITIYYDKKEGLSREADTVRAITLFLNKPILLSKYAKTISNFPEGFIKIEMDPKITHLRYNAHYFNRSESFEIIVQKDDDDREIVDSLEYYGLDSDCFKIENPSWFAPINDPSKPDWEILSSPHLTHL